MAKWDHDDLRDKSDFQELVKRAGAFAPKSPIAASVPQQTVLGTQVGGDHYTSCAIQPVEYIWANDLGFSEGNAVKYLTRWKKKGGIKDLKKAAHHINLLIERAEAEEARTGVKYGL